MTRRPRTKPRAWARSTGAGGSSPNICWIRSAIKRVLHGDIHHENIRYHPQRGWLAFDPKCVYGERTYDCANTLYNPHPDYFTPAFYNEARLLRNAGILAEKLAIDPPRLLAFAFTYGCLSASWSLESGDDPDHALRIAAILERHL